VKKYLIFICIIFIFILYISSKTSTYTFSYNNTNYHINIPNYCYSFKNEKFAIKFRCINSLNNIEKAKNKFLNNFITQKCNNNIYYYDKNENITIFNYNIVQNSIFKDIQFNYYIGNYCNDIEENNIEDNLKDFNFSIKVSKITPCDKLELLYSNDSEQIYTYCIDNIIVETEDSKSSLDKALINNTIQIDKIINKLELDYKYAETTKIIYDNSIVYSNFDYSVISCNTNSKYIISYNDILYNDNFCN